MPSTNRVIQEFPLTFEGGLVTEVEDSTLEVGQAASLVNWVPTAQGGLRARNSWQDISTDGLSADYRVRGWGTAAVDSGGGSQTPALVQSDDDAPDTTTLNLSLAGTTAGNTLIVVVQAYDDAPAPSGLGAYTLQLSQTDTGTNQTLYVYSRTATGGTESLTITQSDAMGYGWLGEVSGVGSATVTDSDSGNGVASIALDCDSPASSGFALVFGSQESTAAWSNAPSLSGGVTQEDTIANGFHRITLVTSVFSGATVSDTVQSDGAESAALMAIWDAGEVASSPAEFYLFLAVATSTGYSVYRVARNSILTGTWELVDSAACDDTSGFVSMAVGAGTLVWSSSTMDVPRAVVLSTLTPSDVTDLDTLAGRSVCHHKDRMFVAGSADEPSRVYFSDIGDPDAFTTATDFLDVGGDDGEAIEDMLSVEGLLLVAKTNRIYLISGSGIESFFVNELPGGSAATGRSAVRTPYGTIVAGPDDIWVVQGGGVDPMSRPLGEGYAITGLVSTAYAQDAVLIADSGTGQVWRANLVTGSWSLEAVNDDENIVGHLFSLQGRLYYGVIDSTTEAGGTRRLSSDRSYDFVGGTSFEASTGKLALLGPSVTYTPSHLYLQVRNHDATLPNALHVQIISDVGTEEKAFMVDEEVKRYRVDLGQYRNASWLQVAFSADSSAIAGALDVERSVLAAYVDAIR